MNEVELAVLNQFRLEWYVVVTHFQICLNAVVNVDKIAEETNSRPSIIRSYVATGISMGTVFSQLLCIFHLTKVCICVYDLFS